MDKDFTKGIFDRNMDFFIKKIEKLKSAIAIKSNDYFSVFNDVCAIDKLLNKIEGVLSFEKADEKNE